MYNFFFFFFLKTFYVFFLSPPPPPPDLHQLKRKITGEIFNVLALKCEANFFNKKKLFIFTGWVLYCNRRTANQRPD